MNKPSLIKYLRHKFDPNKEIDFSQFDTSSQDNPLSYAFQYNKQKGFNFSEAQWDSFIKEAQLSQSALKDNPCFYYLKYFQQEGITITDSTFEYLLKKSDLRGWGSGFQPFVQSVFRLDNLLALGSQKIKILTHTLFVDFIGDEYTFFRHLKFLEKSPYANIYFTSMFNSLDEKEAFTKALDKPLYLDKLDFFKNIIKIIKEQEILEGAISARMTPEKTHKI